MRAIVYIVVLAALAGCEFKKEVRLSSDPPRYPPQVPPWDGRADSPTVR
jgi:hypothetical protein